MIHLDVLFSEVPDQVFASFIFEFFVIFFLIWRNLYLLQMWSRFEYIYVCMCGTYILSVSGLPLQSLKKWSFKNEEHCPEY